MFRNFEGYPDPTAGRAFANIAKEERKALLGAVARELGYAGEDGAVITETLEGIFDCTGSGGAGGLGGLMEGGEIQPGVSVETHVIGI